eukprot:m.249738 g.249738  ORF g.249738 m.249738 type:complete len:1092 (-) comp17514_c0_seq1:2974-6249(-)
MAFVTRIPRTLTSQRCLTATRSFFAYDKNTPVQTSLVEQSLRDETLRQRDELILIPSESICYPECEKIVSSPFGNIYAEGQPDLRLSRASPALATDREYFQAWHRRLSDGRFYRGCNQSDRVELLAKHYIAAAFARLEGSPSADGIYANVQALSGSPANLAIYTALLQPNDNILTLHLSHGGHLSHGSPFNVSGKYYKATQYTIDATTRQLDYDAIHKLAQESQPKMIVGGASAYPMDWDWARLREIADDVGALLHADVCHLAGLIVGGQLKNPLPYSDTVMFTTHKTLMGPRGAVIVSKCKETARKIDNAVFPGMQGGPHMNSIAGIARMFELIDHHYEDYFELQRKIVENTQVFGAEFERLGFRLEYGGTENHMLLLDLKPFNVKEGTSLDGETASRLLENVGVIVNKNTLPGDATAADSSGLRVATPWLTQRGATQDQHRQLAQIIHDLLASAQGFQVWAPSGEEKCRARVPYEQLLKSRAEVQALARSLPYPKLDDAEYNDSAFDPLRNTARVANRVAMVVRGEKARLGLDQAMTCDVAGLTQEQAACSELRLANGKVLAEVQVGYLGWQSTIASGQNGEHAFVVLVDQSQAREVFDWLSALSDGYISLSNSDPYAKVDGPLAVHAIAQEDLSSAMVSSLEAAASQPAEVIESKPYFVGQGTVGGAALPLFEWTPPDGPEKHTVLHSWHVENGGQMVNFGGWDMPVKYGTSINDEHQAVRTSAALFDVSHMSAIAVEGPYALTFLETVMANTAARLIDNEAQYSYILRENGVALDDAYVYRFGAEKYMVVVNAGNFEQDMAWLEAVNNGKVCIDPENPGKRLTHPAEVYSMRDSGDNALLDIAFQGPKSLEILARTVTDEQASELRNGKLNDIHHVQVDGVPVIAARTGYTGESVGFELFMHPDHCLKVWKTLLEAGKADGVVAAGLGARDSARIEAGFPLFGHELEGSESLSLTEADYGYVSRFHRPFYIGRDAYIQRTHPRNKRIIRLQGQGRKSARAGHAVLDDQGNAVGTVTSFAFTDADFNYTVLAAVDAGFIPKAGSAVTVARVRADKVNEGVKGKTIELTALTRFPTAHEKAAWKAKYTQ